MLMVLIFWYVDIDGNLISRYYRRCIDVWDNILIQRALVINIFELL
jgi:hypothetical protein